MDLGLYTSGDWHVKPGHEEAFIVAWTELAEWTFDNVEGCTFAKLLRDQSDPTRFLSFSPWRDEEAVAAWRELPGFAEHVGRIRGLVESFDARSMDVVAESGAQTPDPW